MAVGVKITHKFKSQKADSNDASLIKPSNWNDDHAIVLPGKTIIGNSSVDEGAAMPLTLGNGIVAEGGVLTGGYPGAVIAMAGTIAPAGTLKCNGANVSRIAYARLFAYIGTTHGAGDGATTFGLPDYRAEFLRGLDDGRGVDIGRTIGSAQDGQNLAHTHIAKATIPDHVHKSVTNSAGAHTHTIRANDRFGADASGGTGGWDIGDQVRGFNNKVTNEAGGHIHDFNTNPAGGQELNITTDSNGGTEARPRNKAVLYCIQY